MKKNIQKSVAQALLWSLLLNAFLPVGILAKDKECCPGKTVVTADAVHTDTLHVKCDAKVGNLKVRGDAVVGGDLTVKGRIHGNCPERTADYIIIGVGGAGAVLAKRLTDDRKHSVIALEAGENNSEDPAIKFPENGYLQLLPNYNPQYFWQGEEVPQPQVDDAVYYYSSGRLLGGGTSINGMQYVWGSDNYWAKIEALLGSDWSVDKVHKRYKKMETYTAPFPASPARGTHGLWDNVAVPFQPNDTDEYLFNAFAAVSGMPSILDFNDPSTPNGQFIQYDTSEQPTSPVFLRESSNTAFLSEDIMTPDGIGVNGRQLRVHLRATVLDLLWDNDRVIGVRYTKDGEAFEIYANKEVILCAGFQSAQFLQRNGIGPKDVLDAAGVRVRVDSPLCGQLVNHVYCSAIVLMPPNSRLTPENEPWAVWGPGTMYPQITPPADPNNTIRDVQVITADLGNNLALVAVGLMDPKSVGYVKIQNDDPLKIPLANPNLLGEQADVDVLVNSYQHFMLDLLDYFNANPQPDKGSWTFLSPSREQIVDTAQLEAFLRSVASQAHHYCCQCPAGTSLENGVVDTYGRVFGVKGLRVADVSILPIIPDGNTGTPAGLIGWTISDFILAGK